MNGNTTRVNTSTSQQCWHVLTTLLAILKFFAKKFGSSKFSRLIAFVLQEESVDIQQVKSIKAISGAYVRIRRFRISLHTVFVVLQNYFSSEIAQHCSSTTSDTISACMKENSTKNTDLVPCNPKSSSPRGWDVSTLVHNNNH